MENEILKHSPITILCLLWLLSAQFQQDILDPEMYRPDLI